MPEIILSQQRIIKKLVWRSNFSSKEPRKEMYGMARGACSEALLRLKICRDGSTGHHELQGQKAD